MTKPISLQYYTVLEEDSRKRFYKRSMKIRDENI